MKAWKLLILCICTGCASSRNSHWEVVVSASVESQLSPQDKAKIGLEFKRPITGNILSGVEVKPKT